MIIRGISGMSQVKLITLTLRKNGRSEAENLSHIWKMRNALFHKIRYEGYAISSHYSVCELPNHIHSVADCAYIPQHQLSQWWKGVTGDSFIVDIRKVNLSRGGLRQVVNYLTKYFTKGMGYGMAPSLLKGFRMRQGWNLPPASGLARMPCDCGYEGPLKALYGAECDAYLDWWENSTGPPGGENT